MQTSGNDLALPRDSKNRESFVFIEFRVESRLESPPPNTHTQIDARLLSPGLNPCNQICICDALRSLAYLSLGSIPSLFQYSRLLFLLSLPCLRIAGIPPLHYVCPRPWSSPPPLFPSLISICILDIQPNNLLWSSAGLLPSLLWRSRESTRGSRATWPCRRAAGHLCEPFFPSSSFFIQSASEPLITAILCWVPSCLNFK